jgi:hypothetical protein
MRLLAWHAVLIISVCTKRAVPRRTPGVYPAVADALVPPQSRPATSADMGGVAGRCQERAIACGPMSREGVKLWRAAYLLGPKRRTRPRLPGRALAI